MDDFEAPSRANRVSVIALGVLLVALWGLYIMHIVRQPEPAAAAVHALGPVELPAADALAPSAGASPIAPAAAPAANAAIKASLPAPGRGATPSAQHKVLTNGSADPMAVWARDHGAELRRLVIAGQRVQEATGGTPAGFEAACDELGAAAQAPHASLPDAALERLHADLRSTLVTVAAKCKAAVEQRSAPEFAEGSRYFKQAEAIWQDLRPRLRSYF